MSTCVQNDDGVSAIAQFVCARFHDYCLSKAGRELSVVIHHFRSIEHTKFAVSAKGYKADK